MTWLIRNNLSNEPIYIKYLYSIYWAVFILNKLNFKVILIKF